MSQIEPLWDDAYSIGNETIDMQHKEFFKIAGSVLALNASLDIKEEIRDILYDLSKYVKKHFEDEEVYMKEIAYPELENHKLLHKKIVDNVASILDDNYRIDTIQTKMRLIIESALVDHILEEDTKIKVYQESLHVNKVVLDDIITLD